MGSRNEVKVRRIRIFTAKVYQAHKHLHLVSSNGRKVTLAVICEERDLFIGP